MGSFRVLIYGIMSSVFIYSLVYDIQMPRLGHVWWIYKLVALTYINLVLQTVYYILCFICTLMDYHMEKKDCGPHTRHPSTPSYWRNSKLHRICDFMYYTSAFPIGTATCLLFWILYSINPALVMPPLAEELIPRFLNHVTHTAPIFFIAVDTLLTCHQAPKRKTGFTVSSVLLVIYFSILYFVRWYYGYWIYPMLQMLTITQHIIFVAVSSVFFLSVYYIGDAINLLLWGKFLVFSVFNCFCTRFINHSAM
uniref:Androgen-induced gene 1 protein-like n=1 Tax=Syphacia muris TaxID=451379 RepID=A0A0N5AMI8_9BILA